MSKQVERFTARSLRQEQGMAVKEISRALGVAPSTVSLWVRDIPLTADQEAALRARNPVYSGSLAGHRASARHARAARERAQREGRARARRNDPLHRAGCMLHWAEGSKSRNTVILTNSDVDMLGLFVRFLRECYEVPPHRIRFSVNCHLNNGLTLAQIESWWLGSLGLPPEAVRKAAVNRPSRASRGKHNVLPYGTARVAVHSTAIVQSIYGAIQEYAGIERPEWLDCRVGSLRGPLA